jgi:hypothetical protein
MIEFLSEAWFDELRGVADEVAIAVDLNCAIQFEAGGVRYFLQIEDGNVVGLETGDLQSSEVELRHDLRSSGLIWRRELWGDEAMRATIAVAQLPDGTEYCGPPAPGDLRARSELANLPTIPGASVTVAYAFAQGPFGMVNHWLRFEDGRLVTDGIGEFDEADVHVTMPFSAVPRVRSGECSILDVLEEGTIRGDIGPLALLAGILEGPEFHAAELATGNHAYSLTVLGQLQTNPAWVEGIDRLAEMTALE